MRIQQLDNVEEEYRSLAIAVVESAVKEEGLEYMQTESGRWWLDVMGIDGEEFLAYLNRIYRQAS